MSVFFTDVFLACGILIFNKCLLDGRKEQREGEGRKKGGRERSHSEDQINPDYYSHSLLICCVINKTQSL